MPFKLRDNQLKAIHACREALDKGYKYIILEGPTGSGKSLIAMELLKDLGVGVILTSQKNLQDQYCKDFSEIASLKGSSNYYCDSSKALPPQQLGVRYTSPESWKRLSKTPNCGDQYKWVHTSGKFSRCGNCTYSKAINTANNSKISVMNYHSYYYQNKYRNGLFYGRNVVFDEAHNLNKLVTNFYTREFEEFSNFRFPSPSRGDCFKGKNFGEDIQITSKEYVEQSLTDYLSELEYKLKTGSKKDIPLDDKLKDLIRQVTYQIDNCDKPYFAYNLVDNKGVKTFKSTPINVTSILSKTFYKPNKKLIFMSATILNEEVFCDEMGIPLKEAFVYRMPCSFNPKNHVIKFIKEPQNMSSKNRVKGLDKVFKSVEKILENHKDEKGIIHTQTYAVATKLLSRLENPRLTFDRSISKALKLHDSKRGSVLLSPALKEGVDLKGDKSTFQIILILPLPPWNYHTSQKIKTNSGFYHWSTCVDFVQSLGRSVRSETDYCCTYLVDSRIYSHIQLMKPFFNNYLLNCLPFDMEKALY